MCPAKAGVYKERQKAFGILAKGVPKRKGLDSAIAFQ
jgi:hypothetical protein